MNVTLKNINNEAHKYGIELVHGDGYFYWIGLTTNTNRKLQGIPSTSVMTYRLTNFPWDMWMRELRDVVKDSGLSKMSEALLVEGSSKLKINIPPDVRALHTVFKKSGKKLYVVGGAVRDAILGKTPKDFDLATDAKPDEVERIVQRAGYKTTGVGKSFGIVVVQTKQTPEGHEVATFRKDVGEGRRPDSVDYTDISGDVKRRDLTINALFFDLDTNEIVDLVGGIKDLQDKKIRTVGVPSERFDEDPLRKLRALRFTGLLTGKMGKETFQALKDNPDLSGISPERIRDEFLKGISKSKSSKHYFKLIDELGFWTQIFPSLGVSKDYTESNDTTIQLAWLLRKNKTSVLKGRLNSLKYSSSEINDVVFLNMLSDFHPDNIFIIKKAQENVTLTDSQIGDWGKLIGNKSTVDRVLKFKLSVSGNELLKRGLKGPALGAAMRELESQKFLKLNENMFYRKDMPQVTSDDLGKAFNIMRKNGITVGNTKHNVSKLRASQKDFNQGKVDAIKKKYSTKSALQSVKPIVISKDGYIVDGHHRWLAIRDLYPSYMVSVLVIGLPVKRAILVYSKVSDSV
jgi:tRNA nucleotidyltransferase/poly(A) polymerase